MLVLVMAVVVFDKSAGLCLHLCTTIRKSTKDGLFLYKFHHDVSAIVHPPLEGTTITTALSPYRHCYHSFILTLYLSTGLRNHNDPPILRTNP